jgi:hypothetical protein
MAGARVALLSWSPFGVIVVLAIETFETAFRAPDERLGQYAFLKRLPAGLRAEVWLGLPAGGSSLGQLIALKIFCPHAPGPARAALAEELALAARLGHPNIVQTLRIGCDAERQYLVSEYLEGTTLRALLRRVSVARAGIAPAAVARVLVGIVRAVCHAERGVASPAAKTLVAQTIAADDVFVTFDGAVKLLGFKARPAGAVRNIRDSEAWRDDSSADAAIDALLSEHLTPELGLVLAAGRHSRGRGVNGLQRVGRELQRWQAEVLGSNGRAELAALMGAMFPGARLAQRAQLELRFEQWMSRRPGAIPLVQDGDEHAPASGFRRVLA